MLRDWRKLPAFATTSWKLVPLTQRSYLSHSPHTGRFFSEYAQVCIADAKSGSLENAVRLEVPKTFLPKIASGTFELGEGDEPSNSYSFGKKAEFFEQTFSGKCFCQSGYVGIKLAKSPRNVREKDWTELREKIDKEIISFPDAESGLLFAGPVVHADSVSIYKIMESGDITGLTLTADVEEVD